MRVKKPFRLNLIGLMSGALFSVAIPSTGFAQTANDVLSKMSTDHKLGFINGMVEGFATARWMKDKPDQTGMRCIYNWNHGNAKQSLSRILAWFERHPNKPAGTLLFVLIKKDCGV